MDYVGVRRYGADGEPIGEVRFVGLFTAEAYDEPAREVPLIRAQGRPRAGRAPASRPAATTTSAWRNILENYPRDELFQIDRGRAAAPSALGILHLYDRPRVQLFVRRDPFDRFVSMLLFLPRERYDADLRGAGRRRSWPRPIGGRVSASYPSFSDAPLARVHYIIGVTPGDHASPTSPALEAAIAEAARTWERPLRGRGARSRPRRRPRPPATAGRATATPSRPATATASTPPRPWPTSR